MDSEVIETSEITAVESTNEYKKAMSRVSPADCSPLYDSLSNVHVDPEHAILVTTHAWKSVISASNVNSIVQEVTSSENSTVKVPDFPVKKVSSSL